MRKKAKEIGLRFLPRLTPGTIERLVEYEWPGNVRELANAVERAIIIHEGKPLNFEDIVGIQSIPGARGPVNPEGKDLTLTNMEAHHIRRALEMASGRVEGEAGAAALLGINPGTLRHRMRKLGIPFGRAAKAAYPRTHGDG